MTPYVRYTYIGFALTAAMIAAIVVGAVFPDLRQAAIIAFFACVVARLAIGVPQRIAWRRHLAKLKAANGGALPIPYPVRARRIYAIVLSLFGGLGLAALIAGAVIGGVEQLFLSVLGATFLLATAIFAIQGWRLFRQRAAADLAAAEAATAAD